MKRVPLHTGNGPNFSTEEAAALREYMLRGGFIMVVNFNTDLGDGLEHTFDQFYPTRYCNEAYKLVINYIIYAMSH